VKLSDSELDAAIDAQCALLGLRIAPEHRAGVRQYLQLAAGMAARVMELPLGPSDESGSVFVPVASTLPDADGGTA
jgi:hypothetical protein